MNCPECGTDMGEPVDTTYSNVKTARSTPGQHTGDIYFCPNCEVKWLDDFLSGQVVVWHG